MKIAVTGSLGNICKNLTQQLVESGHEVIGIVRNPEKALEVESIGAIPAIGSVDDPEFLLKLLVMRTLYSPWFLLIIKLLIRELTITVLETLKQMLSKNRE
ncbi:NAD-binding protein [uncultured Chryseobacterium sp.]|uniref:SDR family oxidoreductase n=1 Tax=uncultured Chryseobacterium sp. TaxID=259322 RepID=UPI00258603FB|nr:NAD-binding protein [uncultured Chryseobacterium sp.]